MTDKEQNEHPVIKVAKREVAITKCREVRTGLSYVTLPVDHVVWFIQQTERVQELESKYLALRNIHNITLKTAELFVEVNKQRKEALEKIREISKDSVIDRKYFEIADETLEGEG
ncbi:MULTISPECIES: hypothetical protein [unclassified Virgibacillus]|uniref:hypothetical protein n=1 Tax=unclassified Virgibacillus TaxID=2620237 RepID=UPI000909E7BC|nr:MULTISPECIES: hypothetical protein [unclassified Virgibacillus]API92692.1 hypothetical protein BKP57_13285 [Virgibacillus sp. 6R]MBS7428187.1 hypothetical protein [Virgibacillus sp. 19R1-5]